MSKSAIYTVNATPTSVIANDVIPLGGTVRRFGCNVAQDGNTIVLTGKGYYLINATVTLTPTAAGNIGVSLTKDGVAVIGGTATSSVSTVGDSIAIPVNVIVRNPCECDSSLISFVLDTTSADVETISVSVVKL